jgi:prepilin-type N-terminal cleavage/methylation domain-containing protein
MKRKTMKNTRQERKGFTLIELMIGSFIMLVVIIAALSVYARSNKVAVDQQQFADLQNDVRSGMYFVSRDVRAAGVGLTQDVAGYFIEGQDASGPSPEASDSIRIFGNFDEPLDLRIEKYQGGAGGGAATVFLYDAELENSPYPCPDYFNNRTFLIVSTKCPGCFAYRATGANSTHGCGEGAEHFDFQPGASDLNPPGGLVQEGSCGSDCWDDAIITNGQVKLYWLDSTGTMTSFGEFALSPGSDGYLGVAHVLYVTSTNAQGVLMHLPLARNIENLQFQYNGDLDLNGELDGFVDWDNTNWTIQATDTETQRKDKTDIIGRIRQVQMWVVGRSENIAVSRSSGPPSGNYLYRRPPIANSTEVGTEDKHRRFVLESMSNIRNLTLNIYNTGNR